MEIVGSCREEKSKKERAKGGSERKGGHFELKKKERRSGFSVVERKEAFFEFGRRRKRKGRIWFSFLVRVKKNNKKKQK